MGRINRVFTSLSLCFSFFSPHTSLSLLSLHLLSFYAISLMNFLRMAIFWWGKQREKGFTVGSFLSCTQKKFFGKKVYFLSFSFHLLSYQCISSLSLFVSYL